MNLTTGENSGYFDISKLAAANNELMAEFTTSDWAGLSVLFVQTDNGRQRFPHYADGLSGYLPYWGEGSSPHPLQAVETALRQELHTTAQPLRLLSFQVGQIGDIDREGTGIYDWERTVVLDAYTKIKGTTLERPQPSWRRSDFTRYYKQIRIAEAEKLRSQVVELAGHIVAHNEFEQLYVARGTAEKSSGWMAQLLGLSIDTERENDYRSQIHDVVPVVRQHDGTEVLLRGARALYTAYALNKGNKDMRQL